MIKIENVEIFGWEASIRGLRSPLNSWDKSDSGYVTEYDEGGFDAGFYKIGNNDLDLMEKLIAAGSDHSKFMRMINVTCDITAPLYWWSEYDTYKVEFGWFFNIFTTTSSFKSIMEWRFEKLLNNIKAEAEKREKLTKTSPKQ